LTVGSHRNSPRILLLKPHLSKFAIWSVDAIKSFACNGRTGRWFNFAQGVPSKRGISRSTV
jgi:hypothetical protein